MKWRRGEISDLYQAVHLIDKDRGAWKSTVLSMADTLSTPNVKFCSTVQSVKIALIVQLICPKANNLAVSNARLLITAAASEVAHWKAGHKKDCVRMLKKRLRAEREETRRGEISMPLTNPVLVPS